MGDTVRMQSADGGGGVGLLRAVGRLLGHFVNLDHPWIVYPFWTIVAVLVICAALLTVRRQRAAINAPPGKHEPKVAEKQ